MCPYACTCTVCEGACVFAYVYEAKAHLLMALIRSLQGTVSHYIHNIRCLDRKWPEPEHNNTRTLDSCNYTFISSCWVIGVQEFYSEGLWRAKKRLKFLMRNISVFPCGPDRVNTGFQYWLKIQVTAKITAKYSVWSFAQCSTERSKSPVEVASFLKCMEKLSYL